MSGSTDDVSRQQRKPCVAPTAAFSSQIAQKIHSFRSTRPAASKTAPIRKDLLQRKKRAISKTNIPVALNSTAEVSRDWLTYIPPGLPRLRILFIGHNPSDRSWSVAAPYAHGSNSFWKLLPAAALAPEEECQPQNFASLARKRGIAFGDLHVVSGSDASKVTARTDAKPVQLDLVERMQKHMDCPPRALALVSKTVAQKFLGLPKVSFGLQGTARELNCRGWLCGDTQIWVLPSTSGRAGLRWEERLAPFKQFEEATRIWSWNESTDNQAAGNDLTQNDLTQNDSI